MKKGGGAARYVKCACRGRKMRAAKYARNAKRACIFLKKQAAVFDGGDLRSARERGSGWRRRAAAERGEQAGAEAPVKRRSPAGLARAWRVGWPAHKAAAALPGEAEAPTLRMRLLSKASAANTLSPTAESSMFTRPLAAEKRRRRRQRRQQPAQPRP